MRHPNARWAAGRMADDPRHSTLTVLRTITLAPAAAMPGDATPMLLVKTRLGQSPIDGTGLFAAEAIKAGTVTWRFMPGFDQLFTLEQIAALPDVARAAIETYTYVHRASGLYVYCLDNARFMNHADDPNTAGVHIEGSIEGYDVATRDIAEGEELTCDYRQFDAGFARKIGVPVNE
jgi:hypothetical protein